MYRYNNVVNSMLEDRSFLLRLIRVKFTCDYTKYTLRQFLDDAAFNIYVSRFFSRKTPQDVWDKYKHQLLVRFYFETIWLARIKSCISANAYSLADIQCVILGMSAVSSQVDNPVRKLSTVERLKRMLTQQNGYYIDAWARDYRCLFVDRDTVPASSEPLINNMRYDPSERDPPPPPPGTGNEIYWYCCIEFLNQLLRQRSASNTDPLVIMDLRDPLCTSHKELQPKLHQDAYIVKHYTWRNSFPPLFKSANIHYFRLGNPAKWHKAFDRKCVNKKLDKLLNVDHSRHTETDDIHTKLK